MASILKNAEVKLELLTDIDMLSMVANGIREGICHAIHKHAVANNRYMKNYEKDKKSSYIKQSIWMGNGSKIICK